MSPTALLAALPLIAYVLLLGFVGDAGSWLWEAPLIGGVVAWHACLWGGVWD